ncbi:MAG: pyridoxine 5'-phosphate synthase [Balneolales bacterium]
MNLLVNIDHIATLRNARGENVPDPIQGAIISEQAGAGGIVFHLREDRRHIRDDDVFRLTKAITGIVDFEMAATDEMLSVCLEITPHICTLVPESRQELTTEGGLDMAAVFNDFKSRVFPPLKENGIGISLFIDPDEQAIELARRLEAEAVELHTGTYANAGGRQKEAELERLKRAAVLAHQEGMKVNAGHGLNFDNILPLLRAVPHLNDISIGHALISDALFSGLANSVSRMVDMLRNPTG